MRFFIGLLCSLLSGCFKTIEKPNPKLEETIVEVIELEEQKISDVQETVEEVPMKYYGDLYTEADVRVRIYFDFDRYDLTEEDKFSLKALIEEVKQSDKKYILIVGHSDWYGTQAYNERLGMRRAQTVEDYLRGMGLKDGQLEKISLGSTYAEKNLSKVDSWKDRRCDILIK